MIKEVIHKTWLNSSTGHQLPDTPVVSIMFFNLGEGQFYESLMGNIMAYWYKDINNKEKEFQEDLIDILEQEANEGQDDDKDDPEKSDSQND